MATATTITRKIKGTYLYPLLLLLIAGSLLTLYLGRQHNPDGILYYSYLRSSFFDHDILFTNEFNALKINPLARYVTETGLEGNPVAIGTPLLMAPFYAAAFLIDRFFSLFGIDIGYQGYRGIYSYVFPFGSLFYGCLTGWMILGLLKKYKLGQRELSLLHIMVGTPFMFYMAVHYHLSHLCSAFSVTLLIYTWAIIHDNIDIERRLSAFFVFGAIGGLAVLVRTQNGLFWIIPFCFLLSRLWRTRDYWRILFQGLCFLSGAFVVVSPQLSVWKVLNGHWIHSPEAANINFSQFHIIEVLTSSYHGLFFWSPILILSIIGLFFLTRDDVEHGLPLLMAVLLQLCVLSTMRVWWQGASFGMRLLVNCTPIFCIGLAALYTRIKSPWIRILGSLLVFWSFLLLINAATEKIDLNLLYLSDEIINLQLGQLSGWFTLEATSHIIKASAPAFMLVLAAIITIAMLSLLRRKIIATATHRLFFPGSVTTIIVAGVSLSVLIHSLGAVSHKNKYYWQEDLKKVSAGPNSFKRFYIDYSYYLVHAKYLLTLGRKNEAIIEYMKAVQAYPQPKGYNKLISMLEQIGRYREAQLLTQQALEKWPNDAQLLQHAEKLKNSFHSPAGKTSVPQGLETFQADEEQHPTQ